MRGYFPSKPGGDGERTFFKLFSTTVVLGEQKYKPEIVSGISDSYRLGRQCCYSWLKTTCFGNHNLWSVQSGGKTVDSWLQMKRYPIISLIIIIWYIYIYTSIASHRPHHCVVRGTSIKLMNYFWFTSYWGVGCGSNPNHTVWCAQNRLTN